MRTFSWPSSIIFLTGIVGLLIPARRAVSQEGPQPPEVMYMLKNDEGSLVQLPDKRFMLFTARGGELISLVSADGKNWAEPAKQIRNNKGIDVGLVILDRNGELQNIFPVMRKVPQKPGGLTGPGATVMIDLYQVKTSHQRTSWGKPQRIFEGYCGAILDFKQLRNGRLFAPFAFWVAGRSALPTGKNISTAVYSDDDGKTWHMSDARLTAPTYEGYPGSAYGAIEPAVIELKEPGHLYMLLRTEAGFLYESRSTDYGTTWSPAKPSRFYTYNGPALLKELSDHRLFMVWNNSGNSPKHNGKGVYGGRDAIQAAISDDYGRTWKGFREIHRDPLRNQTPPKTGDRGTSYANSPISVNDQIMLITGMGENRRHIVMVDPAWLTATHAENDFSNGLEEWSIFKFFGPVNYWWRDRVTGPELVDHPSRPGAKVLHIRRPDEKDPDGAAWNFPNGMSGTLTVRIFLKPGFKGGNVALADRYFNPSDTHGERLAVFSLPIAADGRLGHDGPLLSVGQWHTLQLAWNIHDRQCRVINDGAQALLLDQQNETLNGVSYLRLRSMATTPDTAGYLVESVAVDIDDNTAPAVTEEQQVKAFQLFRSKLSYNELPVEDYLHGAGGMAQDEKGKVTTSGFRIPDHVEELKGMKMGPFIRLTDGKILTVDGESSLVSADEGQTWTEYPIFSRKGQYSIRPERALIRTRKGVVILAFANDKERANWHWQNDIADSKGAVLPTYAVRSLDGGKTWETPIKLHDDWTGAIRDMIETREGNIVFTSMMMRHDPGHHTVVTYTTKDQGKTWLRSNVIDLGGIGHHSGVTEATLTQLKDGHLWLLMRTNWGKFWSATSDDEGLHWKGFKPTDIDASSSPGLIKRLASGRLVLVWNRFYPEGKKEVALRGGDGVSSEVATSWQRSELSIMFSNDDGRSWSKPVVIARAVKDGLQASYPYIFEARPGLLWITTMFGGLRIQLQEKDFVGDTQTEYIAAEALPETLQSLVRLGRTPATPSGYGH